MHNMVMNALPHCGPDEKPCEFFKRHVAEIHAARIKRGMTWSAISKHVGIHPKTLRDLMKRKKPAGMAKLTVAKILRRHQTAAIGIVAEKIHHDMTWHEAVAKLRVLSPDDLHHFSNGAIRVAAVDLYHNVTRVTKPPMGRHVTVNAEDNEAIQLLINAVMN